MQKHIYKLLILLLCISSYGLRAQNADTVKVNKFIMLVKSDNGDQLIKTDGTPIPIGVEEDGVKISVNDEWDDQFTTYFAEGKGWQGYGFLHYRGMAVTKPVFDKIDESERNINGIYDFAIVWRNGKAGVFEKCSSPPENSKPIIDTKLDSIVITHGDYSSTRFKLNIGELWGLANKEAKLTIPIKWEGIVYDPYSEQALVKEFDKWGIYDEDKGVVLDPYLDSVIIGDGKVDYKSYGIVVAEVYGYWGAFNWDGEPLGEMEYDGFVKFLPNQSLWRNAAILSKKGKLYRINLNGDIEKYKEED